MVGNAQVAVPEPWFIRDLRAQRLSAGSTAGDAPVAHDAGAGPEFVIDSSRDIDDAVLKPVDVAADRSEYGLAEGVEARRPPVWLYVGAAGLIAIAALVLWLTAVPRTGGAESISVARGATPGVAASVVASAPAATGLCTAPATLDRLRGLIIGTAARAGGHPADMAQAAAGLSLSVAETPDTAGEAGAVNCRGWLSLAQPGAAATNAAVSFRVLPVSGGEARISILQGIAPIAAALITSPGAATNTAVNAAANRSLPGADNPMAAAPAPAIAVMPGKTTPPAVFANASNPRLPIAAAAAPPRYSSPSFDCRRVTSWANRTVCASDALAARDREMAALFDDIAADADPGTRGDLEDGRREFLSRIQRCDDENCIASVYDDRIEELRSYR